VDVARAAAPLPALPMDADGVIVGASVHAGKHQEALVDFVKANRARLSTMPSAFFQVCLAAAEHTPESETEVQRTLDGFVAETGWQPAIRTAFPGMLAWSQYDFFTRLIMRLIVHKHMPDEDTHQDHDFTDYEAVRQFAVDFAAGLP
jgi:menaquinone-dependent protoporphyrinogen oxidase